MKYYAMGQFSRYIRPNDTIIQAGEHVIASWNQEERKLVLVMVNDTNEKQSCKVDLDEFALKGAKICPISHLRRDDGGACQVQNHKLSPTSKEYLSDKTQVSRRSAP